MTDEVKPPSPVPTFFRHSSLTMTTMLMGSQRSWGIDGENRGKTSERTQQQTQRDVSSFQQWRSLIRLVFSGQLASRMGGSDEPDAQRLSGSRMGGSSAPDAQLSVAAGCRFLPAMEVVNPPRFNGQLGREWKSHGRVQ
eukprot:scaffold677_cov77-Skeletonema_dohrnii-CCMP3373.AAC.1